MVSLFGQTSDESRASALWRCAPEKTPEQLAEEERNRKYREMMDSDDPRIWRRLA
jgi:hypothetical protein